MPKVVVTGGLGFIGSAFIRQKDLEFWDLVCIDAMTYAADERRLPEETRSRIRIEALDINDPAFGSFIKREEPDQIIHFAAESHVTRSENEETAFFRANVDGTRSVFEAAEAAGVKLAIHVSSDEVYGPVISEPFREIDKERAEGRATSPYARSKAVADDVARSFGDDIPVTVVRPANCFGPWQHPEKAIARWTTRALRGKDLPVWGDGRYVRDWMFVDDACSAIDLLAADPRPGETFNIAPEGEPVTNLEVARMVAEVVGRDPSCVYLTDYDRPDHDRRYSVDSSKLRSLGWRAERTFHEALVETVEWYQANEWWWKPLLDEAESLYEDGSHRVRVKERS